ncbi:hypothetical protein LP52_14715 [Streptomonospora alba]|uniref:Uncharacterized protein n=1 Tax=Streptomonospora alba TaxID=183763 RepID=A0A0C2JMX2_9ACTN|nr:hypothetical protein [Streptomonospora alba]KIH98177.1 hypothetical protein LP52_14715 [Streptomonospora alba]
MPMWIWTIGILVLATAVFATWRLVQLTDQPRTYFRAGLADPQRRRFPWRQRGAFAPQTVVEETTDRGAMETDIDHETALAIEGERHETTPITTDVDRETRRLLDEEATGRPALERDAEIHRPVPEEAELEPEPVRQRRLAAEEHERAAIEFRRAAGARDSQGAPADEPAEGRSGAIPRPGEIRRDRKR